MLSSYYFQQMNDIYADFQVAVRQNDIHFEDMYHYHTAIKNKSRETYFTAIEDQKMFMRNLRDCRILGDPDYYYSKIIMPSPVMTNYISLRLIANIIDQQAAAEVFSILHQLQRTGEPFYFINDIKIYLGNKNAVLCVEKCSKLVIYLHIPYKVLNKGTNIYTILSSIIFILSDYCSLNAELPLFYCKLANGIGYGENKNSRPLCLKESFSDFRSLATANAVNTCKGSNIKNFINIINNEFDKMEIDPEHPYLNMGTAAAYPELIID